MLAVLALIAAIIGAVMVFVSDTAITTHHAVGVVLIVLALLAAHAAYPIGLGARNRNL